MASRPEDEWILSDRDARVQVWVTWLERWLSFPAFQFATGLAVALVVSTVSAAHLWLNWQSFHVPVSYFALFAAESVEWTAWAAVLPAVVLLDRHMSGRPLPVFRKVLVHLVFLFLIFLFQAGTSAILNLWLDPGLAGTSPWSVFVDRAVFKLPGVATVYVLLVALVRLARSMVRQERLRQDFLNARLANLRAQLQPHFLFNTLNTTASLIRQGSGEAAVESLVELSDLLRRSLSVQNEKEVPLAEELRFLRTYLSIQKRRFGDRLHVEVDVEKGIEKAMVPFFVLQPLCENAVRHGLDLDRGAGRLRVAAFRRGDWLILQVEDSGRVAGDTVSGFGIGLANLQERLRHLYGSSQALELEARPRVDGTRATVRLPFHLADDD